MLPMSVTLEVLKFSGWLKARALCRAERGVEVRTGRPKGVGWRRRKRHTQGESGSRLGTRARAERTWNMYSMFVTLEVSQLEMSASKPVL